MRSRPLPSDRYRFQSGGSDAASSIATSAYVVGRRYGHIERFDGYFPVQLFYVSPTQVNYLVPSATASGPATISLANGSATSTGTALIGTTAPALYTANQTGQGPAIAQVVTPDGTYSNTVQCSSTGVCAMVPINITASPYLILYGTGMRGPSGERHGQNRKLGAPVMYAGAQASMPALTR